MRISALVAAAVLIGSVSCRKDGEFGVDIFSADTIPGRVDMNLTGSLALGIRADNFLGTEDKAKLIFLTPVSLIVQRGEGTATVFSLDTTQSLIVQPLGLPPDSAEKVGVTGRVVKITRVGEERSVRLEVLKP